MPHMLHSNDHSYKHSYITYQLFTQHQYQQYQHKSQPRHHTAYQSSMTLHLVARPALTFSPSTAASALSHSALRSTYITASGSAHPWASSSSSYRYLHSAPLRTGAASAHRRAFSSAPTPRVQAGSVSKASTALKESVKHREEEGDVRVVGDEGKGVEGPHYHGEH